MNAHCVPSTAHPFHRVHRRRGAQTSRRFAEGVILHSTSSQGGFHLDDAANAAVPAPYRNSNGVYEEDCEWAKVAHAFPALFTAYERQCADRTLRDYQPDAYEKVNDLALAEGQSHAKDRRAFEQRHGQDWVVIAALNSDHEPGFVECIAAIGGRRGGDDERRYLVKRAEYTTGKHGFVIDPSRHALYEGPSSFVSWAARA